MSIQEHFKTPRLRFLFEVVLLFGIILIQTPFSWSADKTTPPPAPSPTPGARDVFKPGKSIIYDSILSKPLSGRELPVGYQEQPPNHTFEPAGFRTEPPGYLPTPRGYYEKEPIRLDQPRGYGENPPNFIEKDSHPLVNNTSSLKIDAETYYFSNKDPNLRIPTEEHPAADKDPNLRISRDT